MEATEKEPWALDLSRLEASDVVEGMKRAELESPDPIERGDEPQGRGGDGVEMGPTDPVSDGGMGLDPETINQGTGEIFDGITKVLSGAIGQDVTPTEAEKREAGTKLGPLVQKRFPTVRRYTLETAALIWTLAYFNDKVDFTELG